MNTYLKLEWETVKEGKTLKNALLLLLIYFVLFIGVMAYIGESDQSSGFFSTLAIFSSLSLNMTVFETGGTSAFRRLLPSLPFTRANIFWGRTFAKLIVWSFALLLSYLVSLAANSFLSSRPEPNAVLIGVGISFIVLAIEHLSIHMSGKNAALVRGGLTGAFMGMFISSGSAIVKALSEIFPRVYVFTVGALLFGCLLILINKIAYERRAL